MEHYKLTFIDKIYFLFHHNILERFSYLLPKVEEHEIKYFRKNNISLPYQFTLYLHNYTKQLIWEYENLY